MNVPSARATVFGCLALAGIGWIGSEEHYQSCVARVAASTPVESDSTGGRFGRTGGFGGSPGDAFAASGLARTSASTERVEALNECSRLPL